MKSLGKSGLKVDRRKRTARHLISFWQTHDRAEQRRKEGRKECDKKRASLDIFADGNSTFRNEEGKRGEMET